MENKDKTAVALNRLAREQLVRRLLADILTDLTVCRLEGWNPREYIDILKAEIDGIYEQFTNQGR